MIPHASVTLTADYADIRECDCDIGQAHLADGTKLLITLEEVRE